MHFTFCNNNNNNSPARITVREATEQKLNILLEWPSKETVLSAGTVVVAHMSAEGVRTKASFQVLAVPRDGYNIVMHL